MPGTSCARRCARSGNGRSRSSSDQTTPKASRSCPDAGWSSGPLHGSVATAVLPRISSKPLPRLPHGSSSLRSSSSLAASQEHEINNNSFESDSKAQAPNMSGSFDGLLASSCRLGNDPCMDASAQSRKGRSAIRAPDRRSPSSSPPWTAR